MNSNVEGPNKVWLSFTSINTPPIFVDGRHVWTLSYANIQEAIYHLSFVIPM